MQFEAARIGAFWTALWAHGDQRTSSADQRRIAEMIDALRARADRSGYAPVQPTFSHPRISLLTACGTKGEQK
jgi:hypothetical protein